MVSCYLHDSSLIQTFKCVCLAGKIISQMLIKFCHDIRELIKRFVYPEYDRSLSIIVRTKSRSF